MGTAGPAEAACPAQPGPAVEPPSSGEPHTRNGAAADRNSAIRRGSNSGDGDLGNYRAIRVARWVNSGGISVIDGSSKADQAAQKRQVDLFEGPFRVGVDGAARGLLPFTPKGFRLLGALPGAGP